MRHYLSCCLMDGEYVAMELSDDGQVIMHSDGADGPMRQVSVHTPRGSMLLSAFMLEYRGPYHHGD